MMIPFKLPGPVKSSPGSTLSWAKRKKAPVTLPAESLETGRASNLNLINFAGQLKKSAQPGRIERMLDFTLRSAAEMIGAVAPQLRFSLLGGALVGAGLRALYRSAPVATTEKLDEAASAAPPATRNKVRLFVGDEATRREAVRQIRSAERSVLFESFLLNGEPGREVADELVKKAKEGVPVRVMLDPLIQEQEKALCKDDPNYFLSDYLRKNGVEVVTYNLDLLDRNLRPTDHTKMLLIDGQRALVGGTNFDDMLNHDANVVIEGPAVDEMSNLYAEAWEASGGDLAKLPEVGPASSVDESGSGEDIASVRVLSTDPIRKNVKPVILQNIDNSKRAIDIEMFAFADRDIRDRLIEAHERGVKVRVLLDPGATAFGITNAGVPNLGTRKKLQDAGIEVKEYVTSGPREQCHTKVAIFDGEKVVAGSTNFIPGAFKAIKELGVEIEGESVAGQFQEMFDTDWSEKSRACGPLSKPARMQAGVVDYLSWNLL